MLLLVLAAWMLAIAAVVALCAAAQLGDRREASVSAAQADASAHADTSPELPAARHRRSVPSGRPGEAAEAPTSAAAA